MDNDARQARVLQLGDQTKLYLDDATADYDLFKQQCTALNPKIASIYQQAGMQVPAQKQVEILQYMQTGQSVMTSEVAVVLEVIGDIATFAEITTSLGPPAAKWLKDTKLMPAAAAEKEVLSGSELLYNDALGASRGVPGQPVKVDIEITGADIAGHVLSAMVAGLVIGLLDLTLYYVDKASVQKHLQEAINGLHPLRTAMLLSKHHTRCALDSLKSTDALLDALDGLPQASLAKALTDGTNAIVLTVESELKKAATPATVAVELQNLDAADKSHTDDDPAYVT